MPSEPKGWTSRSVGSRFQHGIFYCLIRLGGRRAAYGLLYFVALYYATFRPLVWRRCAPYLSRRFPGGGIFRRWLGVYRLSLGLGKSLIDRAAVGIVGPGALSARLSGKEKLLGLLGEGRGVILLTAHVGCWQAAMSALSFLEAPVHMLMQREEGDVDRHYFEHAGLESPYRIIDPRGFLGGAVEMADVLKRGEVLCVMGDRVLGDESATLWETYLGAPAAFPISAFKLSASTGAPVAVLFSAKTGSASYELSVADVIRVERPRVRGAEAFRPSLRRFVDALEAFGRNYPYQVFNFYDMWTAQGASRHGHP